MTTSATLEAFNMLESLFFFHLLELLKIWATICMVSRFMAPIAYGMRKLLLMELLYLLFLLSLTLCYLLLEAKATLVTIVSLSLYYMLKGDF